MILLSVIIPFFNTFSRSEKVLRRVKDSIQKYSDIEFILVDDGSTDETLSQLEQYFTTEENIALLRIITQKNKGPGGARNTGLDLAKGQYIWFVDSDDDFYVDQVYADLLEVNDFDFIDYNYIENDKNKNSMGIDVGIFSNYQEDLYKKLGRIWTKIFKREFFINNALRYPESCIYEDNYFVYVLPYYIKKFKKSEKIAYFYEIEVVSVTRENGVPIRFYDRLLTSYNGLHFLNEHQAWVENNTVQERFREIFLYNTARKILLNVDIKKIKMIFYIFCTYNFLEEKYTITKAPVENKINRVIELIRIIFPKKNYMSHFVSLNKRVWHIDEQ